MDCTNVAVGEACLFVGFLFGKKKFQIYSAEIKIRVLFYGMMHWLVYYRRLILASVLFMAFVIEMILMLLLRLGLLKRLMSLIQGENQSASLEVGVVDAKKTSVFFFKKKRRGKQT